MPTIKKPNKSMSYKKDITIDLEKVKKSIDTGAILSTEQFGDRFEYWIKYTEGGCYQISKIIYDKLKNKI